jgi:hypothetical protein
VCALDAHIKRLRRTLKHIEKDREWRSMRIEVDVAEAVRETENCG